MSVRAQPRCLRWGWARDAQVLAEDLADAFVGAVHGDVVLPTRMQGRLACRSSLQRLHVGLRDGTFVHHLRARVAIAAVHGDVAVDERALLQGREVVDEDAGAAVAMKTRCPRCLASSRACMVEAGIWWVAKLTSVPSMSRNRAFVMSFLLYLGAKVLKTQGYSYFCAH